MMLRLFVAIWLPDDVREGVSAPMGVLREHLTRQGVRFTRPEKLHLTLRFLGNVPDDEVGALTQSLSEHLSGVSAPELRVSGLGAFPGLHRPGVVWLGVQGDLAPVHARVVEATDVFAERPNEKGFEPHLTVARVSPPSKKVGRAMEPLVQSLGDETFAQWRPREVALVQSVGGSYEQLAAFPLGD